MEFRYEAIRESLDLSKTDVAHELKIGVRYYNYIESETKNIKLSVFNNYCNHFDCSMDYAAKLTDLKTYKNINKINKINKSVMTKRLEIIEEEQNLEDQEDQFIAEFLGIAKSTYSSYKNPKLPNLMQTLMVKALAEKFGYSMDWITGRSNQKFINKK